MTGDLRGQLAHLVDQLTRPQPVTAGYSYDVLVGDDVVGHETRTYVTTTPPLLEALEAAAVPAASPGGPTGMFESQPAADLDATSVLDRIRRDLTRWTRYLRLAQSRDLRDVLEAVLAAALTDDQAGKLVEDAEDWVRAARVAVGLDRAPFEMRDRCPYCPPPNGHRPAKREPSTRLFVTGDLQRIACRRCKRSWTPDTFELLRRVLNDNTGEALMRP